MDCFVASLLAMTIVGCLKIESGSHGDRIFLPSPGGGGSAHMSAAKCETGRGDLSTRAPFEGETVTPPRRSTGRRFASPGRLAPPPPGQGDHTAPPTSSSPSPRLPRNALLMPGLDPLLSGSIFVDKAAGV